MTERARMGTNTPALPGLPGWRAAARRRRLGALALPFVMVMVGIIFMLGLTGSFQVSSSRKILEKMYARRLHLMYAESAFEEASARLEAMFPAIPFPSGQDAYNAHQGQATRNLKTQIQSIAGSDWPAEVDVPLTREIARTDGVEVGPVRMTYSDWLLKVHEYDQASLEATVQEVGIVEMSVKVKVESGSTDLEGDVVTRRYMDASSTVQGATSAKLNVFPRDMVTRFPEI